MNKCQHGKTIVKFCMFEHCQSKQTGGCQDCIRKYHNHIGQISFLNQDDIKNIVKKFQIQANYRPKSRQLQQCIFNFFTHIKTNISSNLDMVCKNIINQIGYPYLHKNGTLSCYKRLKNKQYRKIGQKQLKQLWQLFKAVDYNDIIKEEKVIYNSSLVKMQQMIDKLQKNVKDIFDNLLATVSLSKSNGSLYDRSFYLKINDIFKQVKKYPDITFPKPQLKLQKKQTTKLQKKQSIKLIQSPTQRKKQNRDTRDVSLDRHVKLQNKLKTQPSSKYNDQVASPYKDKEMKTQQREKHQIEKLMNEKQKEKSLNEKQKSLNEKEKQKHLRKLPKYSFQMRPQQLVIKPSSKIQQALHQNYSQKQQQINQRKKKLLQLMNLKTIKKQQSVQNKISHITPNKDKSYLNKLQVGDYLKNASPSKLLLAKQFITPINIPNKYLTKQQIVRNTSRSNRQSLNSKRAKTTYQEEQQSETPVESKKQTRNQTMMSSQTQTQSLFNAKVHIPFEDPKLQQEFQIKQQSVQKCIVVPQIDVIAKGIVDMITQCQSPLIMKKKQIQNFSAFMKPAQSKIIQEKQLSQRTLNAQQNKQQEKSFVKINKVLQESSVEAVIDAQPKRAQAPKSQNIKKQQSPKLKSRKQEDSVQINDDEQKSLALLLKSLKLPGSQAIPYLQKSIQYSSKNLSAAQYLTYLYLETQRPQDCLKLCNDILKHISSPQSNDLALRLNINKSAALNYLGRYSQCITFLQRCLRYRHNDILYKNLADAYYSIGILQKAIYNYEHSIIQNTSNTQAHYNLAVCHYQQENYHNASIYIDKALKHQPNNQIYKEMRKYTDQKIMSNQI